MAHRLREVEVIDQTMLARIGASLILGWVAVSLPATGCAAGSASGQSLTSGEVTGRVTDGSGPMEGIMVTIRETHGPVHRTAGTDAEGRFRFELLPPGEYVVSAERLGYRPVRKTGVHVRGAGNAQVEMEMREATPPVEEVDEGDHRQRLLARPGGGVGSRLGPLELRGFPPGSGHWTDGARMESFTAEDGGTLGLPAGLSALAVDGVGSPMARRPSGERGALAGMAHPTPFLQELAVLELPYDVEWSGVPGALFHGTTVRGTPDLRYRVQGTWSGAGLRGGQGLPDELPSHADLDASALVTGPVIPDTAHFAAGIHARRNADPLPPYLDLERGAEAELGSALAERSGDALEPYWSSHVATLQSASLFGRGDWQITGDHAVFARAHAAGARGGDADLAPLAATARGTGMRGWDAELAAGLTSGLTERLALEVRGGVSLWSREYRGRELTDEEADFGAVIPPTTVASTGRTVGAALSAPEEVRERTLHSSGTVHARAGRHRIKAGVEVMGTSHRMDRGGELAGAFRFGGGQELLAGRGAYHGRQGEEGASRFGLTELTLFAQNTWRPRAGLELTGGLRLERRLLPLDDVSPAEEWRLATGLDNVAMAESAVTSDVSPRLGFRWDVEGDGRWIVRGGAGVFTLPPHPGVLDEALRYTGGVDAVRQVGDLGRWPEEPPDEAENRGAVLSMLGPRFEGPRSRKGSLGVEVLLHENTAAHLSVAAARTDFLPRRRDLNRREEPLEVDQFGRPLFGELVKEGRLLEVEPGSDRLHQGFDVVSALEADGWSEGARVTLGVEHRVPDLVELSASYTLSESTDNRPGGVFAGPPAEVPPVVGAPGEDDWVEGPSDLMVRHRAVGAAEVTLPLPLPVRVGARYRGQAGLPFTPGLPAGVRAGGQVAGHGDPAYVVAVREVEELGRRWSCLAAQLDGWAQRNTCRGPSSHDLDLRLSVGLLEGEGASAELVVDAVNLLGRSAAVPDPALFLIDPGRDLDREVEEGTVVVPLQVNPNFGQPLYRGASTRGLRIGINASF